MPPDRIFPSSRYFSASDGEPIRSVITQSDDAVIVAWLIEPGQRIAPHVHPEGQDTWTVLAGQGDYLVDGAGGCAPIVAGDVVVAPKGAVHGVVNTGPQPLRLISVVSPGEAGYQPL